MTEATDRVDVSEGMDAETRDLLSASLRELFRRNTSAFEVSAALTQLGWNEVRQGDPRSATTLLFDEQGRALAASRVLDDIVLDELSTVLPPSDSQRAVLYPFDSAGSPEVAGVLLGPLEGIAEVVVPVINATGVEIQIATSVSIGQSTTEITGFDPYSSWLAVSHLPDSAAVGVVDAADAWGCAQAAAHRALATEIAAVCDGALRLAIEYTSGRIQFGRQLATFQSVRHRLAEAYAEISAARAATDAAWSVADTPSVNVTAARTAKLRAGRAQAVVFRHVLQVFGAIGLTADSSVHRYAVRSAALDALLGNHASHAERLGAALLAEGRPHPVVEI